MVLRKDVSGWFIYLRDDQTTPKVHRSKQWTSFKRPCQHSFNSLFKHLLSFVESSAPQREVNQWKVLSEMRAAGVFIASKLKVRRKSENNDFLSSGATVEERSAAAKLDMLEIRAFLWLFRARYFIISYTIRQSESFVEGFRTFPLPCSPMNARALTFKTS